jgi:hypothetical protein
MRHCKSSDRADVVNALTVSLLLTPVWWLLGINIFIYHLVGSLVLIQLLGITMRRHLNLFISTPGIIFCLFLVAYLGSILINAGNNPPQRVFASLNNYFVLIMGALVMFEVYNTREKILYEFCKVCAWLCFMTGVFALISISLWLKGHSELESLSLLGRIMPSLVEYPYFKELLNIRITSTDWLQVALPRVALYSEVHTAIGGFMLMIIPPMVAYFKLRRSKFLVWVILVLALVPLIFSLSRTVLCALIAGFLIVRFLERGMKWYYILILLILVLIGMNFLYEWAEWLLRLRNQSTINRMEIYEEAIRIVWETNIFMGIGIRVRSAYFMMAIGSHSTYVGLLLITGLLGVSLFVLFQGSVLWNWYRQIQWLRDQRNKTVWRYLGISLIASNLWLFTDSLDALPFIAFTYFIIVGCILLHGKLLRLSGEGC